MNERRGLYRSRTDSIIGGVSGGIANYLNTDPTLIRIIFVLLAIFGGGGLLIYLILWIAVPIEPAYSFNNFNKTNMENPENSYQSGQQQSEAEPGKSPQPRKDGSLIAGLALITIGVIFLVDRFVPRVDFEDLWPLILLLAGIALIRIGYSNSKNVKK